MKKKYPVKVVSAFEAPKNVVIYSNKEFETATLKLDEATSFTIGQSWVKWVDIEKKDRISFSLNSLGRNKTEKIYKVWNKETKKTTSLTAEKLTELLNKTNLYSEVDIPEFNKTEFLG